MAGEEGEDQQKNYSDDGNTTINNNNNINNRMNNNNNINNNSINIISGTQSITPSSSSKRFHHSSTFSFSSTPSPSLSFTPSQTPTASEYSSDNNNNNNYTIPSLYLPSQTRFISPTSSSQSPSPSPSSPYLIHSPTVIPSSFSHFHQTNTIAKPFFSHQNNNHSSRNTPRGGDPSSSPSFINYSSNNTSSIHEPHEAVQLTIPDALIGSIIGHGGDIIRSIRVQSSAIIRIAALDNRTELRSISIAGKRSSVLLAVQLMIEKLNEADPSYRADQRSALIRLALSQQNVAAATAAASASSNPSMTSIGGISAPYAVSQPPNPMNIQGNAIINNPNTNTATMNINTPLSHEQQQSILLQQLLSRSQSPSSFQQTPFIPPFRPSAVTLPTSPPNTVPMTQQLFTMTPNTPTATPIIDPSAAAQQMELLRAYYNTVAATANAAAAANAARNIQTAQISPRTPSAYDYFMALQQSQAAAAAASATTPTFISSPMASNVHINNIGSNYPGPLSPNLPTVMAPPSVNNSPLHYSSMMPQSPYHR